MAEATQLRDGLQDPLLRPALESFFAEQRERALDDLKTAVMQHTRDTYKESRIAGRADAFERIMGELDDFARRQ